MRYRTIAEICQGIGINRQQFNKYLSGSAMPNPLTLERICIFLQVDQSTLFLSHGTVAEKSRKDDSGSNRFSEHDTAAIAKALNFSFSEDTARLDSQVGDFPDGDYFCYCQYPKLPGMVIRSLVHVWRHNSLKRFVRVTSFPSPTNVRQRIGSGRHSGTILANQTEIYFLGTNRYSPGQMSLMTIERANAFNNQFYTGLMLTRSHSSPMCVAICMVLQDEAASKRELLGKVGLIHESDLSFAPTVLAAIKEMSFV